MTILCMLYLGLAGSAPRNTFLTTFFVAILADSYILMSRVF